MDNAGRIIDIVAGVFILLNTGIGAIRGGLREVLNLVGIITAFWTAFHYFRPAGTWLAATLGMNVITGYVVGFIFLFIGVWITFKLLSYGGTKLLKKSSVLSSANRLVGAGIGLAKGSLLVTLAGLMIVALPLPESLSVIKDDSWTLKTVERVKPTLFKVLGDDNPLVSLEKKYDKVKDVVKNPAVLAGKLKDVITNPDRQKQLVEAPEIQKVLSHESAREVLNDPSFTEALRNNDINAAVNNEAFQKLLKDPEFVDHMLDEVDLDALKEELEKPLQNEEEDDAGQAAEQPSSPEEQLSPEDEVARKIVDIKEIRTLTVKYGPAFHYLSNREFREYAFTHPKVTPFFKNAGLQALLADPKVMADLAQQKMTPLLQNPKVRLVLKDPEVERFARTVEFVWKEWSDR